MGAYNERKVQVTAPAARWRHDRECLGCVLKFEVQRGSKRAFCSTGCRSLFMATGERLYHAHPAGVKSLTGDYPIGKCSWCGDEYTVTSVRSKYCSKACGVRSYVNGRRRRIAATDAESYSKLEIFKRDGWVCQLCYEDIDPHEVWPSEWCATVDHVVPISEGGSDRVSNLQAAHWVCNRTKSNSLPDMGTLF